MKTVSNVQVLRGLAALGVVIAHAQGELIYRGAPNPLPSLEWGAFGVDVFFVVSGFVMAYSSADAFGRLDAVPTFARRRIIRIVPLYWIATVAFAVLMLLQATAPSAWHAIGRHMLQSMIFLPTVDFSTPILPPGWTLNYEMAFYLCFALVLPMRRRVALVVLAAVLTALAFAGSYGLLAPRLAVIANVQVLEFVAGLAIAEARLLGCRIPAWLGISLALGALVCVMPTAPLSDAADAWRGLVWGPPAAIIVGGLALLRDPPPSVASPWRRRLEGLGDASYSIYVTHYVVNFSFLPWLFWLAQSGRRGALLYFCILLAADAPMCWLMYRYVERPLTRFFRRRGTSPAVATAAQGVAAPA